MRVYDDTREPEIVFLRYPIPTQHARASAHARLTAYILYQLLSVFSRWLHCR